MNTALTRTLPAALVLAAAVAVSASTGAVAGALITGSDIKDGTVASADLRNGGVSGKDVRNGTLTQADLSDATVDDLDGGISGLERVENSKDILAGAGGNVVVACPAGTSMLGIAADWPASVAPTSTWISPNLSSGNAYGTNTSGSTKTLRVSATCAAVD